MPYAFVFGSLRCIPLTWRIIDSSFGIFLSLPLWLCLRWVHKLEATAPQEAAEG
ncbi:MAG: hypothetical protein Q7O66_15780 [Dehalococcoidia bacterium]|nr:hypothetical protein [Dehalococcoidia bacterium]